MTIKSLPSDIINYIFSFLEMKDLNSCSQVDKRFRSFAQAPRLWNAILQNIGIPISAIPQGMHPKEFLLKGWFVRSEAVYCMSALATMQRLNR
jgi:hypothetical protein